MPGLTTTENGTSAPKPKILIPEKVSPDGLALLSASFEVHEKKGLSADEILKIIPEYEALVVRSETKVTSTLLTAAKRLKVVARAGVGVDNVDVSCATKLGIIVVNSPAGNINAAAEHTIALLMAVARNIGAAVPSIKGEKWERSKFVGVEAKGKTLGIIGLGKVGLTVARIANGLGMNLVAYDPYANTSLAAAASVTLAASLGEVLKVADFLTLHTPLIASTKGMIGAAELATMKPTARILNVARGGMIDEDALVEALDAGKIAGAGIDVFTSEPPQSDSSASRLIAHPKVVATPHLGASTAEAQENVSIDVCEQVVSILQGELPRSAVNAPIILPEEYRTLQPYVALVQKIGALYTQHFSSTTNPNQTYRNSFDLIYEGNLASLNNTKPLFAALIKGLLAPISSPDVNINIVNAELVAKERGFFVSESRSREPLEGTSYQSSVTLRARATRSSSQARTPSGRPPAIRAQSGLDYFPEDQIVQGFVTNDTPYISRVGRFLGNFMAEGTLIFCRNYDSPGKIGLVGSRLGEARVNIRSMNVAPLMEDEGAAALRDEAARESLMILGVEGPVDQEVVKGLVSEEGVLEANIVAL